MCYPWAMSRTLSTIAGQSAELQIECLAGFLDGLSQEGETLPESRDGWAAVTRLLNSKSLTVRELAAKLAVKLPVADDARLTAIFATAQAEALDDELDIARRNQAVETLSSAPFEAVASTAVQLLDAREPIQIQLAAVKALGTSTDRTSRATDRRFPSSPTRRTSSPTT